MWSKFELPKTQFERTAKDKIACKVLSTFLESSKKISVTHILNIQSVKMSTKNWKTVTKPKTAEQTNCLCLQN